MLMSNLFNSIFNDATATADPLQLLLALVVSLFLGLALSWAYKQRTLYTREFVISLTLLPCLMTLVIFLVNGSLGTSIAVAGTGYLFLVVLFTVFILGIWLLLEKQQSKSNHQRRRLLTITLPNKEDRLDTIQVALDQFCTESDLISVDTSNAGESLQTVYEVDLHPQVDDFELTSYLTSKISQCDVSLTKKAKKKKNL